MSEPILTLRLLSEKYGVCRLDHTEAIPDWASKSEFYSITRTTEELSIVCPMEYIPEGVRCEPDWRILKIEGPLDFSLTGILSPISTILAREKISIFAVSTYDTDYILVREDQVENAIDALSHENYKVIP